MSLGFGDRFTASMRECGPACVGIDLHPILFDAWDLPLSLEGPRHFSLGAVGALGGRVGIFKPQSASFERFGSKGVGVLEEVIAACTGVGSLYIVDAKRGDIGSTMKDYTDTYLAQSSFPAADAVTLSPYLGVGSLCSTLEFAAENSRGVFVLAFTFNPEGVSAQHCRDSEGRSVATRVVEELVVFNAECGFDPLGPAGVVAGATVGSAVKDPGIGPESLRGAILAPGFGAQGTGPDELAEVFGCARHAVLASSSRAVLTKGSSPNALHGAYEEVVSLLPWGAGAH